MMLELTSTTSAFLKLFREITLLFAFIVCQVFRRPPDTLRMQLLPSYPSRDLSPPYISFIIFDGIISDLFTKFARFVYFIRL